MANLKRSKSASRLFNAVRSRNSSDKISENSLRAGAPRHTHDRSKTRRRKTWLPLRLLQPSQWRPKIHYEPPEHQSGRVGSSPDALLAKPRQESDSSWVQVSGQHGYDEELKSSDRTHLTAVPENRTPNTPSTKDVTQLPNAGVMTDNLSIQHDMHTAAIALSTGQSSTHLERHNRRSQSDVRQSSSHSLQSNNGDQPVAPLWLPHSSREDAPLTIRSNTSPGPHVESTDPQNDHTTDEELTPTALRTEFDMPSADFSPQVYPVSGDELGKKISRLNDSEVCLSLDRESLFGLDVFGDLSTDPNNVAFYVHSTGVQFMTSDSTDDAIGASLGEFGPCSPNVFEKRERDLCPVMDLTASLEPKPVTTFESLLDPDVPTRSLDHMIDYWILHMLSPSWLEFSRLIRFPILHVSIDWLVACIGIIHFSSLVQANWFSRTTLEVSSNRLSTERRSIRPSVSSVSDDVPYFYRQIYVRSSDGEIEDDVLHRFASDIDAHNGATSSSQASDVPGPAYNSQPIQLEAPSSTASRPPSSVFTPPRRLDTFNTDIPIDNVIRQQGKIT